MHVRLLAIKLRTGHCRTELLGEVTSAIEAAGVGRQHAEAARALHLRSAVYHDLGRMDLARAESVRAAEVARGADVEAAAKQLANTGLCLLRIERDVPRARGLLVEAQGMLEPHGLELCELETGLGLLASYDGELDDAVTRLERGLALARRDHEHWHACTGLMHLAEIELARRRPEGALELSRDLGRVAGRLGEGSETIAAQAYAALARLLESERAAPRMVEAAAEAARRVDARSILAYLLVSAAEIDLEAGRLVEAERRARAALESPTAARTTDLVRAHAALARAATGRGDGASAAKHLEAVSRHRTISARARAAIAAARPPEES